MSEDLRFFVQPEPGRVVGPMSDDELRQALRDGRFAPEVAVRSELGPLFLPASAWAALAVRHRSLPPLPPFDSAMANRPVSPDLLLSERDVLDLVRFAVADTKRGVVTGPVNGFELRQAVLGGQHRDTHVAPLGTEDWIPTRKLFDRTLSEGIAAVDTGSNPELLPIRCPICREFIRKNLELCPECDESTAPPPPSRGSFHEEPEGATWLQLHWRPLITFGAIVSLIMSGITLRFVAPERFYQAPGAKPTERQAAPTCEAACWTGEACEAQSCVWQQPPEAKHPAARPGIAGPFQLPPDTSDAILIDEHRFAIALLSGVELRATRTGQSEGLVSEAAHTRKLLRAGDAIYAVGPQHIAVLDGETLVHKKTLEMGGIIRGATVGSNDRRALVAIPGLHTIAVLSTELHVELDRIRFGDDALGPMAVDDTGRRGMVTTGESPLAGMPEFKGGAGYAFDPSRLASEQDRVRASMEGNPVDVLMVPDGETSYVALRAKNQIAPLEWLASGAVLQHKAIETCEQPEQLELARLGRRAVVRCARGKALEVVDLVRREVVRSVPLEGVPTDLVISPDSKRAVFSLTTTTGGGVGVLDLESLELEIVPLTEGASRIRLSADGTTILALGDRTKVAWVIR